MGGLATYRITIPAGGSKPRTIRGDFVYLKETTYPVEVLLRQNQIGGKSGEAYKNILRKGEKWYAATEFDAVEIRNPEAVEVTISIVIGYGDFARELPERISAADVNLTTLGTIAAANTPQLLIAERTFRKRAIVQARLGNTSVCRIAESAAQITAGVYVELAQGGGITHDSKAALWIQSATIGDIVVAVEEYWND